MANSCGNSCIRTIFLGVNFLICVLGALIFGFSLWANLDKNFSVKFPDLVRKIYPSDQDYISKIGQYQASLWIFVGVGALLFIVGFLGCCGACCNSQILLSLFFFIVLILTIIELGATIFAKTNKEKFVDVVQDSAVTNTTRQNFRPIQDAFKCCGATPQTKQTFIDEKLCQKDNELDCYTSISNMIESKGEIVIIIGFCLLVVELLALLFSCLLCRSSKEVQYAGYYS